jgi:hypothetical protein
MYSTLLQGNIGSSNVIMNLSPMEVKVSKRRLLSAICAFGGYKISSDITNIYHLKRNDKSHSELHYEQQLPFRYFENETRLSWDIEENPPVENIQSGSLSFNPSNNEGRGLSISANEEIKEDKTDSSKVDETEQSLVEENPSFVDEEGTKRSNDSSKAKYRCKLCGQPKQNHTCPYQQSLQRNIGTMSYPALNAFECNEPGKLAPTLSEMNNFFNLFDDDQLDPSLSNCDSFGHTIQGLAIDRNLSKMEFSIDGNTMTEDHPQSLKSKKRKTSVLSSFPSSSEGDFSKDYLLRTKTEMRPEQYRTVSEETSSYGSYNYTELPLTFIQRRCMSDSLYNLLKGNRGLLDEVSNVLNEAQQSQFWDVAVAELMAQVLVLKHCPIGDKTLEGLRRCLLEFGISC